MNAGSQADVVVIGAGVAGLAAASALAEAKLQIVLLEARDRIGGRIFSLRPDGSTLPVELGAEFVHGKPPELLTLLQDAGLRCFEMKGTNRCFEHGQLQECSQDNAFQVLEELDSAGDLTFAEFLSAKGLAPAVADRARRYVEGFNAADANRIGTAALAWQQRAEDAIDGDHAFRVEAGYDRLPAFLLEKFTAAGGRLFLSHAVEDLSWQPGAVRAKAKVLLDTCPGTAQFHAKRAIISAPLGVLQARSIRIQPEPSGIFKACDRLAMGSAMRITFQFRRPFWSKDQPDMRFLFSSETVPSTWWTTWPKPTAMITAWAGGPQAVRLMALDQEQLVFESLDALATIFALKREWLREQLLSWHMHDWQTDPFSLGAYSYAPKGAAGASQEMTVPVEDTLYFAGEHTDVTGHWGTVHGALRSGYRAARQILSTVKTE